MALQALYKARSISPHSSELLTRIVDFSSKLNELRNGSDVVSGVLEEEAAPLLNNQSVSDFVRGAMNQIKEGTTDSLDYRCAVAKALVGTKTGTVAEAVPLIVEGGLSCRNVKIDTCRQALDLLKSFGPEAADAAKQWIASVQARFPRLSNFE